ncbi:nucleotide binding protein [Iris pallida]|uniref:Nucleotide binding protein n=1 Tax=Iris pallida TaxID=29817 RepID=A0AAX6FYG7_IRIPA|nr:nucleotide binding protein [Iris pallida]
MKLPVLCSTCSSSEDHIDPGGDCTASLKILSASSTSSSYSLPSTSSTSSEALSIQTFPSLPTLHPNFSAVSSQKTLPLSVSCSLVHSLNSPGSSQNAPRLLPKRPPPILRLPSSIAVYSYQNALTPKSTLPKMPSLLSAGSVKSIAVAGPAPLLFFTAHQDGKIRAWIANNSGKVRLVSSLPTLADRILRYPIPSSHVAVRRHRRRLWIEHADAVSAVAAASGLLYSVSWDKTLKIWRLSDLRCVQSVTAHDDAVNAVAVASDGVVYTGSADTRIRVWSRSGDRRRRHFLVATLEKHRSAVNALAVSGDGRVLYSGSNDRSILVWERRSAAHMAVVGALRGTRGR